MVRQVTRASSSQFDALLYVKPKPRQKDTTRG